MMMMVVSTQCSLCWSSIRRRCTEKEFVLCLGQQKCPRTYSQLVRGVEWEDVFYCPELAKTTGDYHSVFWLNIIPRANRE